MIDVSDFKMGVCILFKDAPMMIVEVTFSAPTARGASTIAKTKLRNLITGQLLSESIRTGSKYPPVDLEYRPASYLYSDGSKWHFLDGESFEQFELDAEQLGDQAGYLVDGIEGIRATLVAGSIVTITLPNTVDLLVTEADPAIQGATAKAQLKWAKVETGIEVQVPSYVEAGEKIRVDTRDGHFVERVKS